MSPKLLQMSSHHCKDLELVFKVASSLKLCVINHNELPSVGGLSRRCAALVGYQTTWE